MLMCTFMSMHIHIDIFVVSAYTWFRLQNLSQGFYVVQLISRIYSSYKIELHGALENILREQISC